MEPKLVGRHEQIVQDLVGRFDCRPSAPPGWRLLEGRGGLVILSGQSGAGKSRIVREVYKRLGEGQRIHPGAQSPYWPRLAGAGRAGDPWAFRKVLGPQADGFIWPGYALPDYFWWHISCSATAEVDTFSMAAGSLLAHREPAEMGSRGTPQVGALVRQVLKRVAPEALTQTLGATVAPVALAVSAVQMFSDAHDTLREHAQRMEGYHADTALTTETKELADHLVERVASWASPQFPWILALEDAHLADDTVRYLIRQILVSPGARDSILILATVLEEGLSRTVHTYNTLDEWFDGLGATTIAVKPLTVEEAYALVDQSFPHTEEGTKALVASRWTNPLCLVRTLQWFRVNENCTDRIVTDERTIRELPEGMDDILDLHFGLLPHMAQLALAMDVVCSADPQTAAKGHVGSSLEDATWTAISPAAVIAAGAAVPIPCAAEADHRPAIDHGWSVELGEGYVETREPAMAAAAWRALGRIGLAGATGRDLRASSARVLAETLNAECQPDPRTGWYSTSPPPRRAAAWMLSLASSVPDDGDVQVAAGRAAMALFRDLVNSGRPQEGLRRWAADWEVRWLDPRFRTSSRHVSSSRPPTRPVGAGTRRWRCSRKGCVTPRRPWHLMMAERSGFASKWLITPGR